MTLSLYVLGLSLRELQEALYHLLGSVLSLSAVNRVTQLAQRQMESRRQSLIEKTPPILIVDGVWIDILYTRMGVETGSSWTPASSAPSSRAGYLSRYGGLARWHLPVIAL